MTNKELVIKDLEEAILFVDSRGYGGVAHTIHDALDMLKEQESRIKKYEYLFGFLGIGFREWATKTLDGEAEVICETDEHEHKTVVTFKLI